MPQSDTSSSSAISEDGSQSAATPTSVGADGTASDTEEPGRGGGREGKVRADCLGWFRDVIAKIKGQKQRPGLERIIAALKPYQTSCTDKDLAGNSDKFDQLIKQQLSFAISQGFLFKVWSNGMPSYKDTDNLKNLRKYKVNSDKEVRRAVTHTLREIGEKDGTVEKDMVDYISYTFNVGVDREQLEEMVERALVSLTAKEEVTQNPVDPTRYISKHLNKKDNDGEGTSRPRSVMSSSSLPRDSEEATLKTTKKSKKKSDLKEETPLSSIADSKPSTSSTTTKSTGSRSKSSASKPEKEKSRPALDHSPEIELIEKKKSTEVLKKPDKKKKRDSDGSLAHSVEILEKPSPPKVPVEKDTADSASKSKSSSPPKTSKLAEAMAKPSKKALEAAAAKADKATVVKSDDARVEGRRPSTSEKAPAVKEDDVPVKKKRGRPPLKKNEKAAAERRKSKSPPSRHRSNESDPTSTSTFTPVFEVGPPPKELQDHLSKFFTPTSARRSRTSQLSLAVAVSHKPSTSKKPPTSESDREEVKAPKEKEKDKRKMKKSKSPARRMSDTTAPKEEVIDDTDDTGTDVRDDGGTTSEDGGDHRQKRKKHGSQQLKGLQDGLSGYFKATDGERKRKPPTNFTPIANKYGRDKKTTQPAGGSAGDQSTTQSDDEEEEDAKEEEENSEDEEEEGEEEEEEESGSEDSDDDAEEADEESKSRSTSRAGKQLFRMPDKIPKSMENLFRKARQRALEKIPAVSEGYDGSLPPRIQLGDKKILTWYTSPFPEEYIRCECLYICEFCLQYMKTVRVLKSHYEKCPWHRPPGTEIYHDTVEIGPTERQELIVYETDGNDWKEYCQNLCLLAKLYLDHKTLYYDVEPFLFYVLTRRDKFGDHLIGYFSKEKNSPQRYNVSCIMVLPPYQGGGFGRYLIDFSYLLSRVEGQHGTPEKPLSELGQQSYHAYWKSAVLDFFLEQRQKSSTKTSIKAICDTTGMWPQDVADTLQGLGFIRKHEETKAWEFALLQDVLSAYVEKKNASKKRLPLVADKLRWDPWRGETMGVTTTESERSGSRAEQLDTGDERQRRRGGNPSGDTSESELDQAMEVQQPATPEPTSPPIVRPGSQRSRGGTPRGGRPGPRKSSSRDRSASPPRPAPVLPVVKRRGRPPKVDRRRKDHGRDGETTPGGRKKRKGKFRSRRSSSSKPTTSSQPKNYKGRGEEFRAGAEKRRKHRRIEQSGDESDISSFMNSPHRTSRSMSSDSSADESLASPSTVHPKHGRPPYLPKEKDIDNESTSSESHNSLSHLDQPPRAPHPPQPVDMMDQGVCTDSPVDHHAHQTTDAPAAAPPPTHQSQHPVPATSQPTRSVHPTSAEICVQTEPLDAMEQQMHEPSLPAAVVQSLEDYATAHQMTDDGVQTDVGLSGGHLEQQPPPQHLMPASQQTSFQQSQAAQMMPSPSFHSTQPSTPYAPGPLSPGQMLVGPRSVGPGPASVSSLHEMQMSQESEMIGQNTSSYVDTNTYEQQQQQQHHYPTNQQSSTIMSATSPLGAYQHYHQQPSPAGSQTSMHNVASVSSQPYQDIRAPQTPTTPLGSYVPPSPRPMPVSNTGFTDQHPDSPRTVMRTPMPPAGASYPDVYARAASVAPYTVDPTSIRNSRSVAPPRYNESCELAQPTSHHHTSTSSSSKQHRRSQRDQQQQQQPTVAASAPTYQAMAGHSNQGFIFHPGYGQGVMAMHHGFMEPHAAYMQQDPTALKNLEQMTRGVLPPGMQHQQQQSMVAAAQYGHHVAAAQQAASGGRSQSQQARQAQAAAAQQQHQHTMQQHTMQQLQGGLGMANPGGLPSPYHYSMTKQAFPGQSPVMNPAAYANPAFFPQGVAMPSQAAVYSRGGQIGTPGQGQPMYTPMTPYAAPFYSSGTPQHPHSGHHASMR